MQTPPAIDRVGSTIGGRYALRRLLGVGGFSAVYEATHTITDRAVALKLLHPHLVTNPEVADRFLLEARAMARIRHEGIVQVLDAGIDESSSIYIVLELLEGESLETCLHRQGTLPWTDVALYCAHVLDALAEAHRYGVVHRDIKPGNIFIARTSDGGSQARLLDFGIALVARGNVRLTGAGMLLGTPEYMSPEQCLTADVGPEADVWAIGVVMWECLTGHTPFSGETATATLLRIAHEQAVPIRSQVPELPVSVAAVIDKALAHDITARWRSAEEMRDALIRVLRKGTGAAAIAAARLAARVGGRTSMLMHPSDDRPSQSEVVDLSVVPVAQSIGGPGRPLAQVVVADFTESWTSASRARMASLCVTCFWDWAAAR